MFRIPLVLSFCLVASFSAEVYGIARIVQDEYDKECSYAAYPDSMAEFGRKWEDTGEKYRCTKENVLGSLYQKRDDKSLCCLMCTPKGIVGGRLDI